MSKYGVISGPSFPVFSPNTGKYGPEINPYLDTFHAVTAYRNQLFLMAFHRNLTHIQKELSLQKDLNAKQLTRQIESSKFPLILAT